MRSAESELPTCLWPDYIGGLLDSKPRRCAVAQPRREERHAARFRRVDATLPRPAATTKEYIGRVGEIAPDARSGGEAIDIEREPPGARHRGHGRRRAFRLLMPRSLGGAELCPAQYVAIIEALARIDASTDGASIRIPAARAAAYLAPEWPRHFRRARRHPRLGAGTGERRVAPGGMGYREMGLRQRQPSRDVAGLHVPVIEATASALQFDGTRWSARCCSEKRHESRHLAHDRLRGTGSDQYTVRTCSCPRDIRFNACSVRTSRRASRRCFIVSAACRVRGGVCRVALGIGQRHARFVYRMARDKIRAAPA